MYNLGKGAQWNVGVALQWSVWDRWLGSYEWDETVERFLSAALRQHNTLPKGEVWHRARSMPPGYASWDPPFRPTMDDMGPPPSAKDSGRVNTLGQPAFYLASDSTTALAELRPWPHMYATVATFEVVEVVDVVDLTKSAVAEPDRGLVSWLSYVFSVPTHPDDGERYRSTQQFRRLLEAKGVRGMIYGSSMSPRGRNLALFEVMPMRPMDSQLYFVPAVRFSFKPHQPGPKPHFGSEEPKGKGLLG